MSRWVDSMEIAEKRELTVKEEGTNDPMEAEEVKKLEGLGTQGMCIRLVLLPRSVVEEVKKLEGLGTKGMCIRTWNHRGKT